MDRTMPFPTEWSNKRPRIFHSLCPMASEPWPQSHNTSFYHSEWLWGSPDFCQYWRPSVPPFCFSQLYHIWSGWGTPLLKLGKSWAVRGAAGKGLLAGPSLGKGSLYFFQPYPLPSDFCLLLHVPSLRINQLWCLLSWSWFFLDPLGYNDPPHLPPLSLEYVFHHAKASPSLLPSSPSSPPPSPGFTAQSLSTRTGS